MKWVDLWNEANAQTNGSVSLAFVSSDFVWLLLRRHYFVCSRIKVALCSTIFHFNRCTWIIDSFVCVCVYRYNIYLCMQMSAFKSWVSMFRSGTNELQRRPDRVRGTEKKKTRMPTLGYDLFDMNSFVVHKRMLYALWRRNQLLASMFKCSLVFFSLLSALILGPSSIVRVYVRVSFRRIRFYEWIRTFLHRARFWWIGID